MLFFCSPDGYLYDKESVLTYIVSQKVEIARQLKRYEKERKKEENELRELSEKAYNDKRERFVQQEMKVLGDTSKASTSSSGSSVSNMGADKGKQLPSFWIPNLTPSSSKDKAKKPSTTVKCPMSGKPLKASQLMPITFTPVDPKVTDPMKATYKCAVTHDALTNSSHCVVLRTS